MGAFEQASASDYVQVDSPQSSQDLAPHITFYLDDNWDKTIEDLTGELSGAFKPIQTDEPDFGYTDSRIWLRLKLENTSPDLEEWRVYVRENFLQYYEVRVQRGNGEIELLELHHPKTKFSERSTNFPELVTPVPFLPGEQITVFVTYSSGGSTNAALSFETVESFAQIAVNRTSKYYVSYGMMVILIFASLFGLIILRMPVFLAYMSYVLVTLFYLIHQDGVAFQYIWSDYPTFNGYFSIIIGTMFVMATYNFARIFLQAATYHPRLNLFMRFMFWLTPALTILGAFINPQLTKQSIFIMVFLAISCGIFGGVLAARTRFKQVRFYLFAWFVGGIGAAGLMNLRHIFGFDIAQDTVFDSVRLSIVIDALMMGLSIADHYIQIQQARQKATTQNLLDAEQNLKLNNRLFALEEQFKLATELAASRDETLRSTVHDLRQPLHALRLNIQGLKDNQNAKAPDMPAIDQTFEYLEALIAEQLSSSVTTSKPIATQKARVENQLSLHDVLSSVYEMFLPDAQSKGLKLTYVRTSQKSDIDPLVLMRIATNLVSNAIKYTPSGEVLLGIRREGQHLRLEVHDTGVGLSPDQFKSAQTTHTRLHKNKFGVGGEGLGLSITRELADTHDFELFTHARRRNGTGVILKFSRIKAT